MTSNQYPKAVAKILDSLPGTHREIAEKAGVSKALVDAWYHGRRTPNPAQLSRLAKLAGGELVIEFRTKKAKR